MPSPSRPDNHHVTPLPPQHTLRPHLPTPSPSHPGNGNITFWLNADDSARLYINDMALGPGSSSQSVSVVLGAGYHGFVVTYVQYTGWADVSLDWDAGSGTRVPVPWSQVGGGHTPPLGGICFHIYWNRVHQDGGKEGKGGGKGMGAPGAPLCPEF